MAIVGSGQIRLYADIGVEAGETTSNVRLGAISKNKGFSEPHNMSEFYGKDVIITKDLVFNLDASKVISYPGTGTTWYDLSTSGINGTLSNVTYSTVNGGAMDFNGTSSLVNMNNDFTSLVPPGVDGEYTLEAWIYVRTSQGTSTDADSIIGHTSSTGFGMQVGVSGGLPRMNYGARSTSNFYGTTFTYNTWNHIVLTRKADVTRCTTYVNGVVEATFDGNATNMSVTSPADGNVQLGYSGPRVTGYFDGLIGEVRVYNRHLSATEVIQNFNATKDRYFSLVTDGLVLYLDAGNPASYPGSGTTWTDLSGNNNHGTLYGPTFDSNFGGFLDFDGTNDYVQIADAASLKPANLTLIFIAHTDNVSKGYQMVIEKSTGGPPQTGYTLRFDGLAPNVGKFKAHFFNPTNSVNSYSTTTAINNAWYFVAATYNGSNRKMYVNGVLEATYANIGAMAYNTELLYLGRRDDGYYLDGGIGVVMIYNRALSDAEVLQNFNATKTRYGL